MKLRTLIESKTSLENLLKGSLPISIAWELKKFVKLVNPELTTFEEIKNEKVKEFGEEFDDNGIKKFRVKEKNLKKYTELIDELLDKDINAITPKVKIKDLEEYKDINGKGIDITTGDLMALEWLIVE